MKIKVKQSSGLKIKQFFWKSIFFFAFSGSNAAEITNFEIVRFCFFYSISDQEPLQKIASWLYNGLMIYESSKMALILKIYVEQIWAKLQMDISQNHLGVKDKIFQIVISHRYKQMVKVSSNFEVVPMWPLVKLTWNDPLRTHFSFSLNN